MKVRESGMPDENMWNDFYDVDMIISALHINASIEDLVEIGCGYGTFTIPASLQIRGKLIAFDIENEMLAIVKKKLTELQIDNVVLEQKDILSQTTGLTDASVDYVMLFNILHNEEPHSFLEEASRILKPNGKIGIIHWRSDIATPRGPDYDIRPKPDEMIHWFDKQKFSIEKTPFNIGAYHFGMVIRKH